MGNDGVLKTMENLNTLISYFSEVQIKLLATKKVARDFENHALAVAATKAGNGTSEIIDILQSSFEALEEDEVTHIPVTRATYQLNSKKKPHLTIVKRRKKDEKND